MQLLSITTIILGLLATAGCGKSEPAKPADDKPKAAEVFSCDDQAAHRCVEHHQENLKMGTVRQNDVQPSA